jgi:hypothetical protein
MTTTEDHQKLKWKFGEFPELLFGNLNNGRTYFDMTQFLIAQKRDPETCISGFTQAFASWIDNLAKVYGIPSEELFVTEPASGHTMAEESLALLFMVHTDPVFGAYMIESMTQMLTDGIVCSDSYILMQAHRRFTEEELLSTSKTNI